jgi:hypothetical protein
MKKKNIWSRMLSVALSAVLAVSMTAMPAKADTEVTLPEPMIYFNFENDAVDGYYEGNGAVGKAMNNLVREEVVFGGKFTQAIKMNRSSKNYLQIFDSKESSTYTGFKGKETITISYWENAVDTTTSWGFFTKKTGTGSGYGNYIGLISRMTEFAMEKQNTGYAGVWIRSGVPKGWRHTTVVVDESGATLYFNGQKIQTLNASSALADVLGDSAEVYLGYCPNWNEYSNMYMDEVKIYDIALTGEQVELAYNAEVVGEPAPDEVKISEVTSPKLSVSDDTLSVDYKTTVSEVVDGIVASAEGATVSIYTDDTLSEKKKDKEQVETSDYLLVSAEGYLACGYNINVINYDSLPEPAVYLDFEEDDANVKGYYTSTSGEYRAQIVNNPNVENIVLKNKSTNVLKFERNAANSKYLKLVDAYDAEEITTVLNRAKSFTVSWWENMLDTSTSWPFFAMDQSTAASDRHYTGVISTQSTLKVQKQYGSGTEASTSAPSGWRHVAVVYNKSGAKTYVNGALKSTLTEGTSLSTILADNPNVYIGFAPWQSGEGSNMYMDEFRLYTSALSAEQVLMDYQKEINGTAPELKDPVTIASVDESVAVLNETAGTLTMTYGVTVGQLKSAITTDPEGATVTVYTDSDKKAEVADSIAVSYTNVVVVSKENCSDTTYTVAYNVINPVYSVSETEDTKSIVYTWDDLMSMSINANAGGDAKTEYIDEAIGEKVIYVAGWTSKSWFYLPTENITNLASVKMDSRIQWYNSASAIIQLNMIDGNNTSTTVGSKSYGAATSVYETNQYFNSNTATIDLSTVSSMQVMFTGNNNGALSGAGLRNVTCIYNKTETEKALDDLIARAEAVSDPDDTLITALSNAKGCKITYASNCMDAVARLAYDDSVMQDAYDILLEALPEDALDYVAMEIVSWNNAELGEFVDGVITAQYDTTVAQAKAAITLSDEGTIEVYKTNADYVSGAEPLKDTDVLVNNGVIVVKGAGYLPKSYPVEVKAAPILKAAIVAMPTTVGYVSGNVLVLQAESQNMTVTQLKNQLSCSPATSTITVYNASGTVKSSSSKIKETDTLHVSATGYSSDVYTIKFLTAKAQLLSLDESVGLMIGQCLYLNNGVTVEQLEGAITAEQGATFVVYKEATLGTDGTVTGTEAAGDELVEKGYSVVVTKEDCDPSAYSIVDIEEISVPELFIETVDNSHAYMIIGGLMLENGTTVADLKSSVIVKSTYYNADTKTTEIATVDDVMISVHEPGGLSLGAAREDTDLVVANDILLVEKEGCTSSQTTVLKIKEKASSGSSSSSNSGGGFASPVTGSVDITKDQSSDTTVVTEEEVPFSRVIKSTIKSNQWQMKVDDGYTLYYSKNGAAEKQYKKKLTLPVGTHTITAYTVDGAGEKSQTVEYTIVVKKPVAKTKSVTLKVDAKKKMAIKNSGTASKIVYKSLDKKVAKVSKTGVVKAVGKGATKIKATLKIGGKNVSVTMKVKVK